MLKRKLGLVILVPMIALTALTACTKNSADDIGTKPAVLEGQSEHWRVKLQYVSKGGSLKEVPTVQYLGNGKLSEVAISIIHNNQDPVVIPLITAPNMKSGSTAELTSDAQIKNWKDTKQVEIDGKVDELHFKEYVYVENKSPAAPAK